MPKKYNDSYIGKKFGEIEMIGFAGTNQKGQSIWRLKCKCGNEFECIGSAIVSKNTKSCGCLIREILQKRNSKHGKSKTTIYHRWQNILSRCYNPNNPRYMHYGGRGINLYAPWHDFEVFYKYMGDPPMQGLSIDRINNDGNYEPGNVRWATHIEQARNTRKNTWYLWMGKKMTCAQIADLEKLPEKSLDAMLRRHSTPEIAIHKCKMKYPNYEKQ